MDWIGHGVTRREFVQRVVAASLILRSHASGVVNPGLPIVGPAVRPADPSAHGADKPLIKSLRLLTAAPLAEMRKFYHDLIGFAVTAESDSEITLATGNTALTFIKARPDQIRGDGGRGDGKPMYHFAFNIPRGSLRAARQWHLARCPLIKPEADLRDADYPDDVWHFRHWGAHSLFFWDPAFNIVEYIDRSDLPGHDDKPDRAFDASRVLHASEIGFVVEDPGESAAFLTRELGVKEYPRGAAPWAMGDAMGLLLCLKRDRPPWGRQTATPVKWGVFPTEATVRGTSARTFSFEGVPYRVNVVAD